MSYFIFRPSRGSRPIKTMAATTAVAATIQPVFHSASSKRHVPYSLFNIWRPAKLVRRKAPYKNSRFARLLPDPFKPFTRGRC
jgi:uncharacterized protein (DUF2461 family)